MGMPDCEFRTRGCQTRGLEAERGAGGGGHRRGGPRGRDAAPVFEGLGALVDEHREAVGVREAEGGGGAQERRLRRVVNHVEYGRRAMWQSGEVQRKRVIGV